MKTNYTGIDYSLGMANTDKATGIHYGVISAHALAHWIYDDAEEIYPEEVEIECPECGHGFMTQNYGYGDAQTCEACQHEFNLDSDMELDPIGFDYCPNDPTYSCESSGDDGDIFVCKSPYKTRARYCSPCAPGACYLADPCDDGDWAFCFGPEYFDADNAMPYDCYSVATGELIAKAGSTGE